MSDFKIHDVESSTGERREVLEEIRSMFPMHEIPTDKQTAEVIAFLSSDRSGGINGQLINTSCGKGMVERLT